MSQRLSPARPYAGSGRGEARLRRLAQALPQRGQRAIGRKLAARRIDDRDGDAQVLGHRHAVPGLRRRRIAEGLLQPGADRIGQRLAPGNRALQERRDGRGERHESVAERLGQRLQVPGDLLAHEAGNDPRKPRVVEAIEQREWHRERQAVERMARGEAVLDRQRGARDLDRFGEELGGDLGCRVAHQRLARQVQERRVALLGFAAPALERRRRRDLLRHALAVERGERLVVDQHVVPPRLVLELGDLGDEPPVVREERPRGRERAGHERLAHEHVVREGRVERGERYRPRRDEREAVERYALARDDLAALFVPDRVEPLARDAIAGRRLDPLRLHARRAARIQARRFDQLGGDKVRLEPRLPKVIICVGEAVATKLYQRS